MLERDGIDEKVSQALRTQEANNQAAIAQNSTNNPEAQQTNSPTGPPTNGATNTTRLNPASAPFTPFTPFYSPKELSKKVTRLEEQVEGLKKELQDVKRRLENCTCKRGGTAHNHAVIKILATKTEGEVLIKKELVDDDHGLAELIEFEEASVWENEDDLIRL